MIDYVADLVEVRVGAACEKALVVCNTRKGSWRRVLVGGMCVGLIATMKMRQILSLIWVLVPI